MDEKISREEYTLDWSQSKVFLVTLTTTKINKTQVIVIAVVNRLLSEILQQIFMTSFSLVNSLVS